jgi:FkbM family methyltransferase
MIKYMRITKFLNKITPVKIKQIIIRDSFEHAKLSYSQEGEDMILSRIFENKKNGFYVDIGAHHPKRFSNTMHFYNLGWRGINIDAMPGSMEAFRLLRPLDINLEIAVSDREEKLVFYIFNEPALNTFSETLANDYNSSENYTLISNVSLQTRTLASILDQYLPENQTIDFLSVDTEGSDLKVLKSNNWDKYIPQVVLVEVLGNTLEDIYSNEIANYLLSLNYKLCAKTYNTFILIKT